MSKKLNYVSSWHKTVEILLSKLDEPFTKHLLEYIDDKTYFNVRTFSKRYVSEFGVNESEQTISTRTGRTNHALKKLGLIAKYNKSSYKNLCKGDLINVLRSLKLQNDNFKPL